MTETTFPTSFELKGAEAEGVIEGYAAIFTAVDGGRDSIQPGAFSRTLAERLASGVRLLWQHDPKEPIGTIEALREDARGLYVKARLDLALGRAREALSLLRKGGLDGLSIGYRIRRAREDRARRIRLIDEVDLEEISLVTFPMQPAARVLAVKAMPRGSIREFEAFLRDAGGFSRREAKAIAAHGLKAAVRRDAGADRHAILTGIARLNDIIKECSR
ncbi:MAG: hypothetical protein Tsb008_23340 [Rhodothalassiaceae bacterium]